MSPKQDIKKSNKAIMVWGCGHTLGLHDKDNKNGPIARWPETRDWGHIMFVDHLFVFLCLSNVTFGFLIFIKLQMGHTG